MRMKDLLKSRAAGIVYIVIAIALVALWITYLNRWNIALSSIDFSPSATSTVCEGFDANGDHYRMVTCHESLALLTENGFGWWKASLVSNPNSQDGLSRISWMIPASIRYAEDGSFAPDWEFHDVYCGNNAAGPVSPITAKLPPNVTVNVWQSGSSYLLHFISFGRESPLSGLSVGELLQSVGAIS